MAFQPVPDTARVAVIHSRALEPMVNVLYFRRPGAWGLPELDDLLHAVKTAWAAWIMPNLTTGVALVRLEARGERAQEDVSSQLPVIPPVGGGYVGDMAPGNVSFVVTHFTGLTGRSRRGRTFFGALPEAEISTDSLTRARADSFVTGLMQVRQAALDVDWTHVVVSRWLNKVRRDVADTYAVIGYRYSDLTVDSQRRRLRK